MILVGCHSTSDFKLFDVENKRIVINRDVIFDEIKNLQQPITSCQKVVIDYNNENFVSVELESAEMPPHRSPN